MQEEEKRVAWGCDGLLWTQHDKWIQRGSLRAVKMSHTASLLTADVTTNEIVNNRCYVIIDKSRMSLKTAADEVVHR